MWGVGLRGNRAIIQLDFSVVFNIGGNNFRLIAYVDYKQGKVFIRAVLTHAEYDKDDWKKDEWYQ